MEPFIFDRVNWLIFCNEPDGSSRYSLQSPFVIGGHLYATDGRVLVRRQVDLPETSNRKLPDNMAGMVEDVRHDAIDADLWQRWPAEMPRGIEFERFTCGCRFGSRLGVPSDSCDECQGTGTKIEIDWDGGVEVNGHFISLRNWRRVAVLPNVEAGPAVGEDGKIPIRFDGGIGIVMPMIREE